MEKVIVVIGPTSVGKTKMGVALAKKFNGEVISGDSMQIYKQMDIGTAKVTEEEKEGIIHHCVDILNPDETYSVHDFQQTVRKKITEITQRGHVPIIVGGTGLYIKAALYDYQFDKDEDQYYDTLSGLQKSIRGSDPNGAMYYFAKLIEYNDIESLERRVLVCAYEDVGLANPNACMRTVAAFQAARTVGFPEARIPIASAIIDLCLSPKSKSSEAAIDAALASLRQQSLPAPEYLRLTPVGLEEDEKYNYDRPELWEYIQYLPDQIANNQFYVPWMTSQYEKALAENYRRILKHGRTSNIKKLNHTKKS